MPARSVTLPFMADRLSIVVNLDEAPEIDDVHGEHWGSVYKIMTPSMRDRGGSLGVNWNRVPHGRTVCPFHGHQREDEVFFILSGRGVLRYGDQLMELRAGDCVSCPAGTGIAHQIANPLEEDLTYLAIGPHDPDEIGFYPDSGKIMVRSLQRIGRLENVDYLDGEPDPPRIFELARK